MGKKYIFNSQYVLGVTMVLAILFSIIGLGFLVFIHELGHFVLAKANGIKVEVFSLGYGKKLIGFKRGDTWYQISYFPLGGYCKMAGEDLKEGVTGAPDEFNSKSPLQKLSVVFAGPFFNYIFGILIFAIIFMFPQTHETFSNKIDVLPKLIVNQKTNISPAMQAGLQRGDLIVNIDGHSVTSWDDIRNYIVKGFDTPKSLVIDRNGKITNITVNPILDKDTGMALIGITPFTVPTIRKIEPDSVADNYGLKINDTIALFNGEPVASVNDLMDKLEHTKYKVLTLLVRRDNILIKKQVPITTSDKENLLGISFSPDSISITNAGHSFFKAWGAGFQKANSVIVQSAKGLGLLFKGKLNARKSMGGPVKILYFASKIAETGSFVAFISFMALLSVLLGFFNLLPIPPIDGSFVLVYLYELITRRKANLKVMEIIQGVGFFLLIALSVLILFNDVISLFGKL